MKDFNIIFTPDLPPLLPDGTCLGTVGEHNAVQLVMTLPAEMVDGMTCHTVTIGGVESARIKENQQSVDGAFRVGRMIFFPLSSTYTTQRITDLTVTAYRLDGGQMVVVDKTPTIYGLTFDDGSPAPVPGGIVSELVLVGQRVDDLDDEVQALADDVPTSEEIEAWNEAAAERHTHANKDVLDSVRNTTVSWSHRHTNMNDLYRIGTSPDGKLLFGGQYVGLPYYDPPLPSRYEIDDPIPEICVCNGLIYEAAEVVAIDDYYLVTWHAITSGLSDQEAATLVQDSHTHPNKPLLDALTVNGTDVLYNGIPIGIKVVSELPSAPAYSGKIVYYTPANVFSRGLYVSNGASWIQITSDGYGDEIDTLTVNMNTLWQMRHTHTNKSVLDKFGESDGIPTFDGVSAYQYVRNFLSAFTMSGGVLSAETSTGLAYVNQAGYLLVNDVITIQNENNELEVFSHD